MYIYTYSIHVLCLRCGFNSKPLSTHTKKKQCAFAAFFFFFFCFPGWRIFVVFLLCLGNNNIYFIFLYFAWRATIIIHKKEEWTSRASQDYPSKSVAHRCTSVGRLFLCVCCVRSTVWYVFSLPIGYNIFILVYYDFWCSICACVRTHICQTEFW